MAFSLLQLCYWELVPRKKGTNEFPQENIPISFSGNVPVMRSVKEYTTTSDLETIGVFAYFTTRKFQ